MPVEYSPTWQEAVPRALRIQACLKGMTPGATLQQLLLCEWQGQAGRYCQLPLHEVQARDSLSHGVLHLQGGPGP